MPTHLGTAPSPLGRTARAAIPLQPHSAAVAVAHLHVQQPCTPPPQRPPRPHEKPRLVSATWDIVLAILDGLCSSTAERI